MAYIICKWKQSGAYTQKDSINGTLYKFRATAETKLRKHGFDYEYVVREV